MDLEIASNRRIVEVKAPAGRLKRLTSWFLHGNLNFQKSKFKDGNRTQSIFSRQGREPGQHQDHEEVPAGFTITNTISKQKIHRKHHEANQRCNP